MRMVRIPYHIVISLALLATYLSKRKMCMEKERRSNLDILLIIAGSRNYVYVRTLLRSR